MPKRTMEERFWPKVQKGENPDDCWLWTAWITQTGGYGGFSDENNKFVLAHRYSYILHKGPISDGLVIDHLCRVRKCVNPAHLEAVTQLANLTRGVGMSSAQTHCKQGHEFTPENIMLLTRTKPNGKTYQHRRCKTCCAAGTARWAAENKEHYDAMKRAWTEKNLGLLAKQARDRRRKAKYGQQS